MTLKTVPLKPRPQQWPAVASTIAVTAQLAAADEYLTPPLARALASSTATDADLAWRYAYAHEDQYGEAGEGWKGRRPADSVDLDDFLDMLVMDDQIGPALGREVDAQFAKDPEWDATQGKAKLDTGHEVITALTEWHREAGLTGAASEAARARLWAGRMVGRVYVPSEYSDRLLPTATDRPTTLAEALELVHVQAVDPREGGPIEDAHGRVLGYWYRYKRTPDGGQEQTVLEVHTAQHVLTYLQDSAGTLTLDGETPADSPFYDAKGPQRARRAEYLMWHADRQGGSAITRSIRDAQDRLNVVNTYMGRNDDQTGYRQFIVSNAEQPKNKKGEFVPFPMGPGIALNVRGLKKPRTSTGLTGAADEDRHTPTWEIVEPLNPEQYHIPSINRWKGSLLEKLDQLWTLTPDVQVSGESKRQSRKPFDRRVAFGAQDTGGFLAWALRSALMLAGQILRRASEYREVTFQPKLYLDVDAINLDELRVKLQMWQAGALTLVSLLESTPGVTDAAKEAKAVDQGEGTSNEAQAKKDALDKLVGGDGGQA